jgi:hypothetical protein
LTPRILANPVFREKFRNTIRNFLDIISIDTRIERMKNISNFLRHDFVYDQFSQLEFPNLLINENIELNNLIKYITEKYNNLNNEIPRKYDYVLYYLFFSIGLLVGLILCIIILIILFIVARRFSSVFYTKYEILGDKEEEQLFHK